MKQIHIIIFQIFKIINLVWYFNMLDLATSEKFSHICFNLEITHTNMGKLLNNSHIQYIFWQVSICNLVCSESDPPNSKIGPGGSERNRKWFGTTRPDFRVGFFFRFPIFSPAERWSFLRNSESRGRARRAAIRCASVRACHACHDHDSDENRDLGRPVLQL